jgi:hypothetical protein
MPATATVPSASVVGPGDFAPDPNSPFFMSRPEFQSLQTYCDDAATLPTTPDELVSKIGISRETAATFQDMLDAYSAVQKHCANFSSVTFPKTVSLASMVAQYGLVCSQTYLPALILTIQEWQDETDPVKMARYQKKVDAILTQLASMARQYAAEADSVQAMVGDFLAQTTLDKNTLEPIQKKYHDKYEAEGGVIADLQQKLKDAQGMIDSLNDEYKKDVTIACTTATYAWLFPAGTIAAAVVAGVYGKRAQDALDQIHSWEETRDQESVELQKDINLMADLHLADHSIGGLLDALRGALPIIRKIRGIWGAIHDDIAAVAGTLIDARKADLWVKDNVVDAAARQWKAVSDAADNYRINAYITTTTVTQIKSSDPKLFIVPKAS